MLSATPWRMKYIIMKNCRNVKVKSWVLPLVCPLYLQYSMVYWWTYLTNVSTIPYMFQLWIFLFFCYFIFIFGHDCGLEPNLQEKYQIRLRKILDLNPNLCKKPYSGPSPFTNRILAFWKYGAGFLSKLLSLAIPNPLFIQYGYSSFKFFSKCNVIRRVADPDSVFLKGRIRIRCSYNPYKICSHRFLFN